MQFEWIIKGALPVLNLDFEIIKKLKYNWCGNGNVMVEVENFVT